MRKMRAMTFVRILRMKNIISNCPQITICPVIKSRTIIVEIKMHQREIA